MPPAEGVPLAVIPEWLGHSEIAVTMAHYAAVVPQLRRDAADAIRRRSAVVNGRRIPASGVRGGWGSGAMTPRNTWVEFHKAVSISALAHQQSATSFATLRDVLAYGGVAFGVLGGLTLINASYGQIAAICSLIAAGLAGALKVQDLDKRQAAHHKKAAAYQELADEAKQVIDIIDAGEVPTDDFKKKLRAREHLDGEQPLAPDRIYKRAGREWEQRRNLQAAPPKDRTA
jgi:hypothetical protein